MTDHKDVASKVTALAVITNEAKQLTQATRDALNAAGPWEMHNKCPQGWMILDSSPNLIELPPSRIVLGMVFITNERQELRKLPAFQLQGITGNIWYVRDWPDEVTFWSSTMVARIPEIMSVSDDNQARKIIVGLLGSIARK